jgi:hypothetical protein
VSSPFGSFDGREPFEFVPGVRLRAVGGEQVLLCRVTYEPGKQIPRHSHEHHVPDRDRDLVLGRDGGAGHVER